MKSFKRYWILALACLICAAVFFWKFYPHYTYADMYRISVVDKATGQKIRYFYCARCVQPFDRIEWKSTYPFTNTDGCVHEYPSPCVPCFEAADSDSEFGFFQDEHMNVLCVYAENYSMACQKLPQQKWHGTLDIKVELEEGKGILGHVVNAQGDPVPGAEIHVGPCVTWERYTPFKRSSVVDGSFWLPDLCAKVPHIGASSPGIGQAWTSGEELFAHPEIALQPFASLEVLVTGEKLPKELELKLYSPYLTDLENGAKSITTVPGTPCAIGNLPPGNMNVSSRLIWDNDTWVSGFPLATNEILQKPLDPFGERLLSRTIEANVLLSSDNTSTLTVKMETASSSIKGNITVNGNTASGYCRVQALVRESSGMVIAEANSGISELGAFDLGPLPTGFVLLSAVTILNGRDLNSYVLFDLPVNSVIEKTLNLVQGEGKIIGRTVGEARSGNLLLWLIPTGIDSFWRDLPSQCALDDILTAVGRPTFVKNRQFSFKNVQPGEYRVVRLTDNGQSPLSNIREVSVTVPENGNATVDFPLQ